jgi:hypothetical protein
MILENFFQKESYIKIIYFKSIIGAASFSGSKPIRLASSLVRSLMMLAFDSVMPVIDNR